MTIYLSARVEPSDWWKKIQVLSELLRGLLEGGHHDTEINWNMLWEEIYLWSVAVNCIRGDVGTEAEIFQLNQEETEVKTNEKIIVKNRWKLRSLTNLTHKNMAERCGKTEEKEQTITYEAGTF
jgi:hypothetical protein